MTTRLATGGRLIDRSRPLPFTFNGRALSGYQGDTLASALLAKGQMLVGRSFKYHRPRGIVASGHEEPNALLGLGSGPRFEPNQRATTTALFAGAEATSQNHWPSLEWDIGAVNNLLMRFLPAGFYYKMFIHPRPFWKHVYEPLIRRSAGLGRAPVERDADSYEQAYAHAETVVVGGGVAGLAAALEAAAGGGRVIVLEQCGWWGGRAPVDGALDGSTIDGADPGEWVRNAVQALESMPNVTLRLDTQATGLYDHGYL
ncbi:MAG: 2Fe-2S iron-sulfur cluster-binding protein, partial [Rhodobacteraceae bacterium]|nr:2Fe-2S iron-sulfur cluster-binding protein [Paracoccaceae bacterium]